MKSSITKNEIDPIGPQHNPPFFRRVYLLFDLIEDASQLTLDFDVSQGLRQGIVNKFRHKICGQLLRLNVNDFQEEEIGGDYFEGERCMEMETVKTLPVGKTYIKLSVTGSEQHLAELFTFLDKYKQLWSVREVESEQVPSLPVDRKLEIKNGLHVENGKNSGAVSIKSAQRGKTSDNASGEVGSRKLEKAESGADELSSITTPSSLPSNAQKRAAALRKTNSRNPILAQLEKLEQEKAKLKRDLLAIMKENPQNRGPAVLLLELHVAQAEESVIRFKYEYTKDRSIYSNEEWRLQLDQAKEKTQKAEKMAERAALEAERAALEAKRAEKMAVLEEKMAVLEAERDKLQTYAAKLENTIREALQRIKVLKDNEKENSTEIKVEQRSIDKCMILLDKCSENQVKISNAMSQLY